MNPCVMLVLSNDGNEYLPANGLAVTLTKLVGKPTLINAQIPLIEAMGFRVIQPNGQPLPPAKAYSRPQPVALRVREEA